MSGEPVSPDQADRHHRVDPHPAGLATGQPGEHPADHRVDRQGRQLPQRHADRVQARRGFDAKELVKHGNDDARLAQNFKQLESSDADFHGFPSSMIEGSYNLGNQRLHTINRIVIAHGAGEDPDRT